MNFLEVKLELSSNLADDNDFVAKVIQNQSSLGQAKPKELFNAQKLENLGFTLNTSTNKYYLKKELKFKELKELAKEISTLQNHSLIHGAIVLKFHQNELYFWDTTMTYSGMDTFSHCLKNHNLLEFKELKVITLQNFIKEEILNTINYSYRYEYSSVELVTNNLAYDKKTKQKVPKDGLNLLEYMQI